MLVSKIGFSYSDVKKLTRTERTVFLKLYKEDKEAESDAIKRSFNS